MPIVLGELLAGIIIGPFALGGLIFFDGEPLVVMTGRLLIEYPFTSLIGSADGY